MNVNFGLFPPLANPPTRKPDGTRLRGNEKAIAKRQALSARALYRYRPLDRRSFAASRGSVSIS